MNYLPERIVLCNPGMDAAGLELLKEWRAHFGDVPVVEVSQEHLLAAAADAVVSPANSFGYMDDGVDKAISEKIEEIGVEVRERIARRPFGELLVGDAEVVPTGNRNWPYLICAPTMRVPGNITATVNAYLAFRAALNAARQFNEQMKEMRIDSIACPGLGTGFGKMPAYRSAYQMRIAYNHVYWEGTLPIGMENLRVHGELLAGEGRFKSQR